MKPTLRLLLRNKWLIVLIRAPLLAYVVSVALMFFFQDSLLYAGAKGSASFESLLPLEGSLPDADGRPRAWVAEPESGKPRATVVFFHGNFEVAHQAFEVRYPFVENNLRVLFAEYPGYGNRKDLNAKFDTVVPDAKDLVVAAQRAYPNEPVWLFGASLGAGVAAQAANPQVARVMLAVPWNSLSAVAKVRYPWLPVESLLKNDYDSCAALTTMADKVWVVYAENDRVIPAENARALAQCLKLPPERVHMLKDATHNGWFYGLNKTLEGWPRLLDSPIGGTGPARKPHS